MRPDHYRCGRGIDAAARVSSRAGSPLICSAPEVRPRRRLWQLEAEPPPHRLLERFRRCCTAMSPRMARPIPWPGPRRAERHHGLGSKHLLHRGASEPAKLHASMRRPARLRSWPGPWRAVRRWHRRLQGKSEPSHPFGSNSDPHPGARVAMHFPVAALAQEIDRLAGCRESQKQDGKEPTGQVELPVSRLSQAGPTGNNAGPVRLALGRYNLPQRRPSSQIQDPLAQRPDRDHCADHRLLGRPDPQ